MASFKISLAIGSIAIAGLGFAWAQPPIFSKDISFENENGEVHKDKIHVLLAGSHCADTVELNFRAKHAETFGNISDEDSFTARLMNNVKHLILEQCSQASLIKAAGKVPVERGGETEIKTVYSGAADKGTNWKIVEYGARNSGGFLSSVTRNGQNPELPDYLSSSSFLKYAEVQAKITSAPIVCTNHNTENNSCTLITEFTDKSTNGSTMVTRQMIDDEGAIGTVTLSGTVQNGLWCGNPQEATVTATGGKLLPDSKSQQAMEEMLLERIQDNGDQVCVGYAEGKDGMSSTQFDEDGFQLYSDMPIVAMAETPNLRRD